MHASCAGSALFLYNARSYFASPCEEYSSKRYSVLYYAKANAVGIRRKWGDKKQAFQYGGMSCGLSESSLRSFADDCLKKLDQKQNEATMKKWVDGAIAE